MFYDMVTSTDIILHLMVAVGVIGIVAKLMNLFTIRRMLTAAANMSKSTHKLIKLVRSKYEQACMLRDHVENTEAFVEKYIYEYRGNFLKLHTWRQLEKQSVWGAGILAAIGAVSWYQTAGVCEELYQYVMMGAAEMILLFVIGQLSDEQYKLDAVKNYMVEYLENISASRYRRQQQNERDQIDVIQMENAREMGRASASGTIDEMYMSGSKEDRAAANINAQDGLSINIEGKPRTVLKEDGAGQLHRKASKDQKETDSEADLKEETIRQILEEFLA